MTGPTVAPRGWWDESDPKAPKPIAKKEPITVLDRACWARRVQLLGEGVARVAGNLRQRNTDCAFAQAIEIWTDAYIEFDRLLEEIEDRVGGEK